ncbi:ABC transporter substrate-binding protein [Actinomyces ruminis]|uniref:Carbohydrate ABC transporter substrate-binding protein n=1 Tax=Actinomyces ruminis TaxID=1937003 RepID=A0ABX4MCT2_9ACTO|nr:ABC transporter substrate-binding protein [Actinomyces ruminis]PHP53267.1 carbohydrate ABC transporter substrate-binding protein [Actinomyces ruminis]
MRSSRTALRRTAAHLAPATAALLLLTGGLTACSTGDDVDPTASATDPCAALAAYGTFADGTTVTIATAFTGTEAERFDASVEQFEECTGIDVVQHGSDDLESVLRQAVDAAATTPEATDDADVAGGKQKDAELPDLAVVPQPGLVGDLARAGMLVPVPDSVGANVELGWDRAWMDVGSVDGVLYAAPLMASVKSFIWYSPVAFAQAGYEVPTTWDELVALTARIAADNAADASEGGDGESTEDAEDGKAEEEGSGTDVVTPWCLGASDGDSTGWVVSDWLEEALLATDGVGAYDAWAGHVVALDDASAVDALDAVGSLLLTDGNVPGGGQQAVNTTVEEAGAQLLDGSCYMLHASSGYENLLPEGAEVVAADGVPGSGTATAAGTGASDSAAPEESASAQATASQTSATTGGVVSAFLVPGVVDDDAGAPVIVGGDFLVQLSAGAAAAGGDAEDGEGADPEAVEAVMTYLSSAEWAQARVDLGGVATANRGVDASRMSSDVARRATLLLQSRQSVIRFDASDSMPSTVGTDALWSALTQWTAGELDSKEALAQAEAAWPE